MVTEKNTLWIKHLPQELEAKDQEDLLRHFGAVGVRCMNSHGRMKHTAFATFENHDTALEAIKRLHQLEVLGCRLSAEFASVRHARYHPALSDNTKPDPTSDSKKQGEAVKDDNNVKTEKKVQSKINSFSSHFGFEYPIDPRLEYIYPPPTVHILTNIANALASVPKFYVQVLHLMNKMNLPAPFGPVTSTPPLPQGRPEYEVPPPLPKEAFPHDELQDGAEESSTEESEIDSGDEEGRVMKSVSLTLKRPPPEQSNKPKKKHKLQHIVSAPKIKPTAINTSDVFEKQSDVSGSKNIEFKFPAVSLDTNPKTNSAQNVTSDNGVGTIPPTDLLSVVENEDQTVVETGGFGKIAPTEKVAESDEEMDDENEEWGDSEFITSRQLRRGRISSSEMRHLNAFKNYTPGEVTTRLYIKNLVKNVTEKDLHYIFGRYVDWNSELEKNMFDIRLMDGRMKGQAFVTLPNEKVAREAVKDTHGFELQKKPIVVQFARSAKPKENDQKDDKKKAQSTNRR